MTPSVKRLNWDSNGQNAQINILVGFEKVLKAYRVFHTDAKQVDLTRDVNFDESLIGIFIDPLKGKAKKELPV